MAANARLSRRAPAHGWPPIWLKLWTAWREFGRPQAGQARRPGMEIVSLAMVGREMACALLSLPPTASTTPQNKASASTKSASPRRSSPRCAAAPALPASPAPVHFPISRRWRGRRRCRTRLPSSTPIMQGSWAGLSRQCGQPIGFLCPKKVASTPCLECNGGPLRESVAPSLF